MKNSLTSTSRYAKSELDILIKSTPDAIIIDFIPEILALVEKFGKSGQSGGSAPYTAHALSSTIEKLCLQEPICPITGIDDEWNDVSSYGDDPTWQNKRCSSLFKYKDGKIKYIDSIVWKTDSGSCFSGGSVKLKNGDRVNSSQEIRGFPFTPKTFYIDVIQNDRESVVKDESQLDEVFGYYKNITYIRDEKIKNILT